MTDLFSSDELRIRSSRRLPGGATIWTSLLVLVALILGNSFIAIKRVVECATLLELVTARFVPVALTFAALLLPTPGRQVYCPVTGVLAAPYDQVSTGEVQVGQAEVDQLYHRRVRHSRNSGFSQSGRGSKMARHAANSAGSACSRRRRGIDRGSTSLPGVSSTPSGADSA